MRRVVLGTAGHIDHGKTALVKALTGIDTDRLAEEKRRGITIELGFAHLDLGGGVVAGLVDVPGHERFVKAMVAGAGGIDVVMLVVAADEGVMPQTREHVDVCNLLGVKAGVVALTKSDLLPGLGAEWLPLLTADVREALRGTFLESAPIVPCSSRSGEGLPALLAALSTAAGAVAERPADGPAFLPVDRSFTLKGFGTVVTGTLLHGRIAPGDSLDAVPGPSRLRGLRVRGVQVHGKEIERAQAGQRTAVNLAGVEAHDIPRGAALVPTGTLSPTPMFDAELELLSAARPLKHGAKLLCHLGTGLATATVALLDRGSLAPGARALAQLRLASPLAALPGMRFILRGFAPLPGRGTTVGGGRVLAIHPRRRRAGHAEATRGLEILQSTDDAARVAWLVEDAGPAGLEASALWTRTALPRRALDQALDKLSATGVLVLFDKERRTYAHAAVLKSLGERARGELTRFHAERPLEKGMPTAELRARLGNPDPRLFTRVLSRESSLKVDGDLVRVSSHEISLGVAGIELQRAVLDLLAGAGLAPPTVTESAAALKTTAPKLAQLLRVLAEEGAVVKVKDDLFFDTRALTGLRERLVAHLRSEREITTQTFKDMVGQSRKFVIPLSEYFDREKVTLRVGDKRILRGGDA